MRIAIALAVVLLAGCGGGSDGDAAGTGASEIDLIVTYFPNGVGGDNNVWQLKCEPVGGDLPDREAACAKLATLKNPFAKLKPTPRCDEIPGATPDVAQIKGTYRGTQVDETFDRSSGCVFERWDRLVPVLPTAF